MTHMISSGDEGGRGRHAAKGSPAEGSAAHEVRVLVVEDEWFVSMEIAAILENAGYVVADVAATAGDAVRMAEIHRPDLIMMDIRLKGSRDGVEAAVEINQRLGLRCLFVSAYVDDATRKRAQAARPLGWLPKPFNPRQLLEALQRALRDLEG